MSFLRFLLWVILLFNLPGTWKDDNTMYMWLGTVFLLILAYVLPQKK